MHGVVALNGSCLAALSLSYYLLEPALELTTVHGRSKARGKKQIVAHGPLIEWELDEREGDLSHHLGVQGAES